MTRRALMAGGLAALSLTALPAPLRAKKLAETHRFGKPKRSYDGDRVARLRFEARNTTNQRIDGGDLLVFAPVGLTATQQLRELRVSRPSAVEKDAFGNRIVRVPLGDVPPYGLVPVTITAMLGIASQAQPTPKPRASLYRGVETYIETESEAIVELAASLKGKTAMDSGRAFHRWIATKIKDSGFVGRDRGAAFALDKGLGDCSEMAYLHVALCRAAGIPARYVGGYVVESSALLVPEEYHNWSEFYDGKTWRISDPQKRQFNRFPSRFVATNIGGVSTEGPLQGVHRYKATAEAIKVRMLGR